MSIPRLMELRRELQQHKFNYFHLDRPTVSDREFDEKLRELIELEAQHPELKDPNSPSARVGLASLSAFAKVKHKHPMLSLDNAFNMDEVKTRFGHLAHLPYVVEPKVDGLSLSLHYRGGKLIQAVTRGDGTTGDDVTPNARTIGNIPLEINDRSPLEVRGEAYMPRSVFTQLNEKLVAHGEEPFANPRNAASGSLKQKDSRVTAKRGLKFIAYNLIGESYDHDVMLERLETLSFETTLPEALLASTLADVETCLMDFDHTREQLDYDTDGAVIKILSATVQREMGNSNTGPRWAMAYKYPPKAVTTRLLDIILTVGRTGVVTPNAVLQPVQLEGSTVKAASLCNADEIDRLGLSVGGMVSVVKAGAIIPKVTACVKPAADGKLWKFPTQCPCCGSTLSKRKNATGEDSVHIYCLNDACRDQVQARLEYALGKTCLDMDGAGPALVKALIDEGVKDLAGVFEVSVLQLEIGNAALDKFCKEAKRLVDEAPHWRWLAALGIEGIGKTLSQELMARFGNLRGLQAFILGEEVGDAIDQAFSELETIVGPVNAASLHSAFQTGTAVDLLTRLQAAGLKLDAQSTSGPTPLAGKVFCITGSLETASRDDMSARIEAAGGTVKSSVSKKVHFLVAGHDVGRTKTEAAAKCGTQVISEQDLLKMLGEQGDNDARH